MPNYHLHLINAHVEAYAECHDLPDLDAAHRVAIVGIRDFVAHEARTGVLDFRGHIHIEDDRGNVLRSIPFAEASTIKGL